MPDPDVVRPPMVNRSIGTPSSDFVISENLTPPGRGGTARRGVPLHRHRLEDEAWYVLEGALRFQYDRQEIDAPAGTGVLLPRGTAHTFWNPGPKPARYLLIMGPKTAGLLDVLHGPNRPAPTGLKALYDAFEIDLLE
ncbi:MAG TPA: cupin domain-containing protein [Thermoplasmata archaeon]|nr:cupin domain-containing protein [Thermoplasmata archaeon]